LTRKEFRETRLLLDLTQAQVADYFGMNRNTITKWELGLLRLPSIAVWAIKAYGQNCAAEARERPRNRERRYRSLWTPPITVPVLD
jgi:DNA-binding XRE family transcriptional regulator